MTSVTEATQTSPGFFLSTASNFIPTLNSQLWEIRQAERQTGVYWLLCDSWTERQVDRELSRQTGEQTNRCILTAVRQVKRVGGAAWEPEDCRYSDQSKSVSLRPVERNKQVECCHLCEVLTCEGVGLSMLTFGWVELMVVVFTPAYRSDVWWVRVHPEVITFWISVNMETEPTANHLTERERE